MLSEENDEKNRGKIMCPQLTNATEWNKTEDNIQAKIAIQHEGNSIDK